MTVGTGIDRLDDLLGGGLPDGSATLVLGSDDTGVDVMSRLFVLEGARQGEAAIVVLTDDTAVDFSEKLAGIDADVPAYEEDGLIRYVDATTADVGSGKEHAAATTVASGSDLNALTGAMNEVQSDILTEHDRHRVVIDDVSTAIVKSDARSVYRFLQVLLGRTRQAGGTVILLMDPDDHDDREIDLVRQLTDGIVETRRDDDEAVVQVRGLGLNKTPGWVEYTFDDTGFTITGALGAGRIP